MSVKHILKNIYVFVDILQSAFSRDIASWNNEAFQNAFQWAKYCQEIHSQSTGKPYHAELADYVTEIGELPWGLDLDEGISLNSLKEANHLLLTALLKNEFTPDFALVILKSTYSRVDDNSKTKNGVLLDKALIQARIVIRQLLAFQRLPALRQEKCKGMLDKKLTCLLNDKEGQTILLTSLSTDVEAMMLDVPTIKLSAISEAQTYILDWLMQHPSSIWRELFHSKNCLLLRDVSKKYLSFYKPYIQHLIKCAHSLRPEFDQRKGKLVYRIEPSSSRLMDIADLQIHFEALSSQNDQVGTATRQTLTKLLDTDSNGVWSYLQKQSCVNG